MDAQITIKWGVCACVCVGGGGARGGGGGGGLGGGGDGGKWVGEGQEFNVLQYYRRSLIGLLR